MEKEQILDDMTGESLEDRLEYCRFMAETLHKRFIKIYLGCGDEQFATVRKRIQDYLKISDQAVLEVEIPHGRMNIVPEIRELVPWGQSIRLLRPCSSQRI